MIKILFLDQRDNRQEYVIEEFVENGFEVTRYRWDQKQNMRNNKARQIELEEKLKEKNFLFVFSINFFPIVAQACKNVGVRYISWVYDSPCRLLYSAALSFITNYVFIFDQSLFLELRQKGISTVYYLPLAAPVEYYDKFQCSETERQYYQAQISFFEPMCAEEDGKYGDIMEAVNEYTKGYLEALMNMQHELQSGFILEDALKEQILKELQRVCPLDKANDEWEEDAWIYANCCLAKNLTAKERSRYLKILSDKHDVKLYGNEMAEHSWTNNNRGTVDYHTQMLLVFKNSKINLNFTQRSIHTGIPLRAMEILGCRGFLLTNYQEELLNFFEPNVDFVFFENEEDLLDKAQYYLLHTEEREQIAQNGYEKVKKMHSYRHRVAAILSIVFPYNELNIYRTYDKVEKVRQPNVNYQWYKDQVYSKSGSEAEFLEYVDQWLSQMEKEKDLFLELKEICLSYINTLLAQGTELAWDFIVLWRSSRVGAEMHALFRSFNSLSMIVEAYTLEKKTQLNNNGRISVLQLSSMKQIEDLCFYCEFLFRRIERDMPEEDQKELIKIIKEYRLTETVLNIILEKKTVPEKLKIKESLSRWWRMDDE